MSSQEHAKHKPYIVQWELGKRGGGGGWGCCLPLIVLVRLVFLALSQLHFIYIGIVPLVYLKQVSLINNYFYYYFSHLYTCINENKNMAIFTNPTYTLITHRQHNNVTVLNFLAAEVDII